MGASTDNIFGITLNYVYYFIVIFYSSRNLLLFSVKFFNYAVLLAKSNKIRVRATHGRYSR